MPDDIPQVPDLSQLATPNELAFRRAYAKGLIEQGMGPIQGPAVSPFQGIGGVLQALAGKNMLNNAAQAERQRYSAEGAAEQGGGPPGIGPLSAQPPADAQATGYTDDVSKLMPAIAREEGTGSYSQLGPVTKTGDRAYGKYQIMGTNIPQWSREILGQALTPDQFLRNPGAQEAIARAKLGQYAAKYGPEGAARAWFAGEHGMNNLNAKDQLGITVGQYGANVAAMAGGGGTPQAQPQNASAVGPLAFRPPAPGGVPVPNAGMPSTGAPAPGLFTMRPRMSDAQYRLIMGSPDVPVELKKEATDRYLGQNQPVSIGAYGGNYVLNPSTGQEMFIPGAPTMGTKEISAPGGGGIKTPYPVYAMPPGGGTPPTMYSPPIQTGPQSSAAPVAPPGAPQVQPTEAGGAAPGKTGMAQPAQPAARLAMAEEPGTMSDAAPPGIPAGNGPLSATPPTPASMQTAQASGLPPGISPEDAAEMGWLQKQGQKYQFNLKDQELYNKEYTDATGRGTAANAYLPQILYAKNLIEQPGVIQGPGADFKVLWNKGLTLLGDKDAEQKLSYDQVFGKMISGGILRDMKTMLGGWAGQVRNAEIALMNRASAGHYNTIEANRAILDMGQRSAQQLIDVGNAVREYRLQATQNGQVPTTAGQQEIVNQYLEQHPLYTPEEIQTLNHTFDIDKSQKTGGPLSAAPPGIGGPGLPPGAVGPLKKVQ